MAQNEEMKRLLFKGKIVGYEYRGEETLWGIMHSRYSDVLEWGNCILYYAGDTSDGFNFSHWIDHDSFELGIKVNDEWVFEGDRIQGKTVDGKTIEGILNAPTINHGWVIMTQGISTELWSVNNAKRIGNIHEENNQSI